MPWWLWVLLGGLALAGESISMALFLLYVAIAAFVAALLALLHIVGPAAQVGVFVVLSLLLIGLVRPRMLARRVPHRALTNQGRLVDRLATVTQTVTSDGGMVRVGNAEFWTARVTPPTQRIEVSSTVRIVYVNGLTAYVEPVVPIPEVAPAPGRPAATQMAQKES